jgi:hypothetical protein
MKVTSSDIKAKVEAANQANQIGWLDTEKMNTFGVQTSKPLKLTGYEPKENAFRECQTKKPFWGF